MRDFFKKIRRDDILMKIVKFFYENPSAVDTATNIASWIGEEEKKVKRKLDYLVQKDILNKDKSYLTEGYSYTQDKELISKITDFIQNLKDE